MRILHRLSWSWTVLLPSDTCICDQFTDSPSYMHEQWLILLASILNMVTACISETSRTLPTFTKYMKIISVVVVCTVCLLCNIVFFAACLACPSTLKTEVVRIPETSVNFNGTPQCNFPEGIVTCISDYRRGSNWKLDLLTPYAINSYLQALQRNRWITQFTVTHAVGFSVFASRLLVTEFKQFHRD
jgi:hypothetical protein